MRVTFFPALLTPTPRLARGKVWFVSEPLCLCRLPNILTSSEASTFILWGALPTSLSAPSQCTHILSVRVVWMDGSSSRDVHMTQAWPVGALAPASNHWLKGAHMTQAESGRASPGTSPGTVRREALPLGLAKWRKCQPLVSESYCGERPLWT